jgi:hypothetical protein
LETLPLSTKGDPVLSLTTASSCSFEQPIRANEAMRTEDAIGRVFTVELLGAAMPRFPSELVRAPRAIPSSGVLGSEELKAELERGEMPPAEVWAATGVLEFRLQLA